MRFKEIAMCKLSNFYFYRSYTGNGRIISQKYLCDANQFRQLDNPKTKICLWVEQVRDCTHTLDIF